MDEAAWNELVRRITPDGEQAEKLRELIRTEHGLEVGLAEATRIGTFLLAASIMFAKRRPEVAGGDHAASLNPEEPSAPLPSAPRNGRRRKSEG